MPYKRFVQGLCRSPQGTPAGHCHLPKENAGRWSSDWCGPSGVQAAESAPALHLHLTIAFNTLQKRTKADGTLRVLKKDRRERLRAEKANGGKKAAAKK
ncbi:hypothetical protein KR018_005716 [Drosophila ironensis]|nr:hypothetical protein KR018_005716 [Drosophila ironensis]